MNDSVIPIWADTAAAELGAVYGNELGPGTLLLTVTGAPGGDVDLYWRSSSGTVKVDQSTGQADVAVTVKYADFLRLLDGEVPPPVAYMQGRLKPSGDMESILRLLKLSVGEDFERWRQRTVAVD